MTQRPDDHLKALWQGQETETKPMSVDAIRTRAARYTNRRRLTFLFGAALMLFEIVIFGRYALILPGTPERVGMLAVLVGLGWTIARWSLIAPAKFPAAQASGETILEYHRTELQRHSESFKSVLVMVGPLLLAVMIAVVAAGIAHPGWKLVKNAAPVFGLIALWLVAVWWLGRKAEKKRLRQLAEIEATRVE